MFLIYFVIFVHVASVFSQIESENEVKITTEQGSIVGFKDGDYLAFHGIPYAGQVTGLNRFKAALPPPKLDGDFRADKKNILCAQPSRHGVVGVEDCLTLNVFTKKVTGENPVYVWLNGEDYSRTNDTPPYTFRSLVRGNLVVLAVNYRLSIFGFLCLGVEQAPGNAGLKDVIQALKWIKANIKNFGGDPENITLLGHGSGAAMVDLITLSLHSQDLVHKAIVISGSGLAPWAVAFDPAGYAEALAAKLNYTFADHQNLADKLVNTTTYELATAINDFKFQNSSLLFAPCVENTQLSGSFLEDAPINLIKAGKFSLNPYIAIYMNDEGTLRVQEAANNDWLVRMQDDFVDFLPADLKFDNEVIRKIISENLRTHYFKSKNITLNDYLKYWGDILVTVPLIRGVRERLTANKKFGDNTYVMKFDYTEKSDPTWPDHHLELGWRARHGAILKYILDFDSVEVRTLSKEDLTNRLVAFAETGNPVAPIHSSGDLDWPNFNEDLRYLSIIRDDETNNNQDTPSKNPHNETVEFWEKNIAKYYAIPQGNWPSSTSEGSGSASSGYIAIPVILAVGFTILYFYRQYIYNLIHRRLAIF